MEVLAVHQRKLLLPFLLRARLAVVEVQQRPGQAWWLCPSLTASPLIPTHTVVCPGGRGDHRNKGHVAFNGSCQSEVHLVSRHGFKASSISAPTASKLLAPTAHLHLEDVHALQHMLSLHTA